MRVTNKINNLDLLFSEVVIWTCGLNFVLNSHVIHLSPIQAGVTEQNLLTMSKIETEITHNQDTSSFLFRLVPLALLLQLFFFYGSK